VLFYTFVIPGAEMKNFTANQKRKKSTANNTKHTNLESKEIYYDYACARINQCHEQQSIQR